MNPAQIFENYPFEVKPLCAHGGRGYVISFPDLPGCMCVGQTVEEAIANGRDAFHAWMASAIADGAQIPAPTAPPRRSSSFSVSRSPCTRSCCALRQAKERA